MRRSNTLLITDGCTDRQSIMVNFTYSAAGQIGFELNRPNIVYEGLKLSPDIVRMGGTELDIAELYHEMESALQKTKETVDQQ